MALMLSLTSACALAAFSILKETERRAENNKEWFETTRKIYNVRLRSLETENIQLASRLEAAKKEAVDYRARVRQLVQEHKISI